MKQFYKKFHLFTLSLFVSFLLSSCQEKKSVAPLLSFTNPLDLSYRFMLNEEPSCREAADPTVVLYKGTYYLFASKTGGYWYSDDLADWTLVLTDQIPTEEYAPTAIVMRDTLFFMASNKKPNTIYKSADPKSGIWSVAKQHIDTDVWDPCLFRDDDGKLYLYWGCSNKDPLYGVELDTLTFDFIGEPRALIYPQQKLLGWEIRGDYNTQKEESPWIEGAWMNKINGVYHLQYASPGTREKSYCDAVYKSENPLGPFELAKHNPFAYKPEGFVCGAGHGSTFSDKYGNLWHIGTSVIAVNHKFERRLVLYPTFVDENGELYSWTRLGDYPQLIPDKKIESPQRPEQQWMLLSYRKPVSVSSTLPGFDPANMTDENIRTHWSASSDSSSEWAMIDLQDQLMVHAIQINFAEQDAHLQGRSENHPHQFLIECSSDKKEWSKVADRTNATSDNTHPYIVMDSPVSTRYIRIQNIRVPDGCFAISGMRIFGKGNGEAPAAVQHFTALRNKSDLREVYLSWNKQEKAVGYNIRYGEQENLLHHNYQVYGDTTLTIRSLNAENKYYFAIEAFNENGVGKLSAPIQMQ